MDVYGLSSPDHLLRVDDLLDFSNDEIFSSSSIIVSSATSSAASSSENPFNFPSPSSTSFHTSPPPPLTNFAHDLCIPSDDAAHLEWLSRFVDDSFSYYPSNSLTMTIRPEMSFTGKPRSRRSRAPVPSVPGTWAPTPEAELCHSVAKRKRNKKLKAADGGGARRCTHCASEQTPQWRTGPLGPKTLCNACGVRFKSGRLVPEYRPASSPTFVVSQHSNSHRKVMELRRKKEQLESCVQLPAFQPQ